MTSEPVPMSWDYCPTEMLYMILKQMDIRMFFRCRCVCKRWKQIADDIGQDHKIWKRFCKEDYSEYYLDLHRKSQLPWINVYKNIQLWYKLKDSVCNIDSSISYNHLQIINVHVFKDKLIVVCNTCIKYFLIHEFTLIKTVGRVCLDYQENEHMNLELKSNKTLCLYGKSTPSSFFANPLPSNENHSNVICYRLHDEQCYFIDQKKRALWICEWRNNAWKEIFLARYYGVMPILDMNIWKDEVYILLQGGDIYKVTSNEKKFCKLLSTELPPSTNIAFLFRKCDVLASVNTEFIKVHKRDGHNSVQIPGLTCFIEHGGMLILGYINCGIQIYDKDELTRPLQKKYMKNVSNNRPNSNSIIAIDICEYYNKHFVIASTNSTVHVISYSHPCSKISEELYKMFCIK